MANHSPVQRALYKEPCRFDRCHNNRRKGEVFCHDCYFRLPKNLKNSLYTRDVRLLAGNITLCLTWLDENTPDDD